MLIKVVTTFSSPYTVTSTTLVAYDGYDRRVLLLLLVKLVKKNYQQDTDILVYDYIILGRLLYTDNTEVHQIHTYYQKPPTSYYYFTAYI